MKKNNVISIITKGQIFFALIVFSFVFATSFILQSATANETSENISKLNYVIVLDAGHGGLDVK